MTTSKAGMDILHGFGACLSGPHENSGGRLAMEALNMSESLLQDFSILEAEFTADILEF